MDGPIDGPIVKPDVRITKVDTNQDDDDKDEGLGDYGLGGWVNLRSHVLM